MNEVWHRIVDVVTPHGGAVVAIAEIYFDETGTHDGSSVVGVAGYVFMKSKSAKFSKKWRAHLARKKLPYFHMKDCAPGNGPYAGWDVNARIEHEKRLISLIKETSLFGFAACCPSGFYENSKEYELPSRYSPYSFLLLTAINMACNHLRSLRFQGRVSFIFEAGHNHQSQANELVGRISNCFPEKYFNPNFAFVRKSDAPPLAGR